MPDSVELIAIFWLFVLLLGPDTMFKLIKWFQAK
jgi:hypothetical protein